MMTNSHNFYRYAATNNRSYQRVAWLQHLWVVIEKYILNVILLILAFYLLFVKEMSFTMHFGSSVLSFGPSQNESLMMDSKNLKQFSLLDGISSNEIEKKVIPNCLKKENKTNVSKQETKKNATASINVETPKVVRTSNNNDENLANNFNNLTFVLNPNYAKENNISSVIVNLKKEKCEAYINEYSSIAKSERKKYGIPASIILAQGLLESNAGESRLTKLNANHFGIKCFSRKCKKGHCSNFTDDTHKDFFRRYPNAWQSYREHSEFLQNKRYAALKFLSSNDYKGWAFGLKRCGYATDKKYAEKLIQIIESLKLDKYDL